MHAYFFVNSSLVNLLQCASICNLSVDALLGDEDAARNSLRQGTPIENCDLGAARALYDICMFREGVNHPGFVIHKDEIETALCFFIL
jgi:hypothetical protein